MNNDIKEILDKLNNKAEHYILYDYEAHLLLDCITNLRESNKFLNNIIDELEKELKLAYTDLFEYELVNGRELIENTLNVLKELKEGSDKE